jgi:topoisomerase-4 subunit A
MTRVDVAADREIACLSSDGYLLVFASSEIKKLSGGGRGITMQDLAQGARLVSALSIGPRGVVVVGQGRGGREMRVRLTDAALEAHRGRRARKGRKLDSRIRAPVLAKPEAPPTQGDA